MHACIFGGTTEGRLLAEFLSENNAEVSIYIATEYGEQFIRNLNNVHVHQKRLDKQNMIDLFQKSHFDFAIDATHPFAKVVSQNACEAAKFCDLGYYRIVRKTEKHPYPVYFDNIEDMVCHLNDDGGNILLTTGSKDLHKFLSVKNYEKRIFVRILPMLDSLKRALELGYANKNIICMQGPISEELNAAMINSIDASFLITKESAASGGFLEKVHACMKANIKCFVLKMPHEEGIALDDFKQIIRGKL